MGESIELVQICVIVNFGSASRVLKIAKQNGITGGTIYLGKGTVKNKLLELFELNDIRKEIVILITEKNTAEFVLVKLNSELHLSKPNHGIAFCTAIKGLYGSHSYNNKNISDIIGGVDVMYNAIYTIVDKGLAENVIEAAEKAGSTGGTIINGRGSGIHETSKLFSMEIEPSKEIVLILSKKEQTDAIIASIKEELKIDEPGKGIIFVQDVIKTYGLS